MRILIIIFLNFLNYPNFENSNQHNAVFYRAIIFRQDKDTLTLEAVKESNISKYKGKKVGVFLESSTFRRYLSHFWVQEPYLKLKALRLNYSKDLYILIYVNNYKYVKKFSEKREWSFELYQKEIIYNIEVYYRDKLIDSQ